MSQVAARSSWWRSLFHSNGVARGDVAGGLTAAVVLLAIEGSYGLIAYSRLGPEQAQLGFVLGVHGCAGECNDFRGRWARAAAQRFQRGLGSVSASADRHPRH